MTQKVTDLSGVVHEFPDEATPEMIAKALGAGFVANPRIPVEKQIDTRSGAIAVARRDVGGAMTPPDKLATLQRYYPDAQPYGADNFIFTDPNSGRLVIYNPPGVDAGDFASIIPEIFEFTGGMAGAVAATPKAVAQAPFTGGKSLWKIPVAVGLGAGAGREVENLLATNVGERVDTRSLPRRTADAAVTIGTNAVAQRAGDVVAEGVKRFVGPPVKRLFTKETPAGLKQAFEDQAITPMAGPVSGSRPVQIAEHALAATPGGAGVIQQSAEKTIGETGEAAKRVAQSVGTPSTAQGMGQELKGAAAGLAQKFTERRETLDAAIETTIGHDTPVRVDRSIGLIRQLYGMLSQAPNTVRPKVGTAVDELQGLLADAGANLKTGERGNVPFWVLRGLRTRIGQMLDAPDITGYSPGAKSTMRELYAVLAQDIRRAAESAGPEAVKALKTHDRYVRLNRTINLPALQKLVDTGTDEQAFAWAIGQAAQGGSRLEKLRRQMPKETWDNLVSTVITRMGQAKPGQAGAPLELLGENATFSPDTFLTNFNKMSPEARTALFGGSRYAELRESLEQLTKVTASLKDAGKMANASGSGRILLYGTALSSLGAGLVTGDLVGAAVGGGGAIVAPYVAAKLITNPRFVRWMASTSRGITSPFSMNNTIARLINIGKVEPEITDEINQFVAAFRSNLGVPSQQNEQEQTRPVPTSVRPPGYASGGRVQGKPMVMAAEEVAGLLEPGNIDLTKRPKVKNADGSISTVRSMSFNIDGREVLVPTVSDDGRIMSDDEAYTNYFRTGRHLGIFDTPKNATAYAKTLHDQQDRFYNPQDGGYASGGRVRGNGSKAAPVQLADERGIAHGARRTTSEPSPAQIEAQNYAKRHLKWRGLDISIETEKGGMRRSKPNASVKWETKMFHPYGHILRTKGGDGDPVDIFVGPKPQIPRVFVIDQKNPKTGRFDEHKVVIGVRSPGAAAAVYDGSFSDGSGPERRMAITEMEIKDFKQWLRRADKTKPAGSASASVVFVPTKAWQTVPAGAVMPDGLEFRPGSKDGEIEVRRMKGPAQRSRQWAALG